MLPFDGETKLLVFNVRAYGENNYWQFLRTTVYLQTICCRENNNNINNALSILEGIW